MYPAIRVLSLLAVVLAGLLTGSIIYAKEKSQPLDAAAGRVLWKETLLSPEEVADRAKTDAVLAQYEKLRSAAENTAADQLKLAAWCKQKQLVEQERAHLTRVIEIDPSHAEARRLLGYKLVAGQWLSRDEMTRSQARARAAAAAFKRYSKPLSSIANGLTSASEKSRQAAKQRLLQIADPAAIPVMEAALKNAAEPAGLALVEALSKMTSPDASVTLARVAVETESRDVRDAAVKRLKEIAYDYYVPVLLSSLVTPLESKVELYQAPDGRLTYRHWFYCEGEDARRMLVVDQAFRRPRGGQVNDGDSLADRESALAVAATQESIRNEDNNERICKLLSRVTDLDLPAKPDVWWSWWNDLTETALAEEKPLYQQYVSREEVLRDARRFYGGTVVEPGGGISGTPVSLHECLIAGTPIWTIRGSMAVESIKVGDLVLSQEVETGALAYKPVLRTTQRPPAPLVSIELPLETITASGGHLFWTEGSAWQRARRIEAGTPLVALDGVVDVGESRPVEAQKTYNLIVADFHTYFVGKSRILSHDNTLQRPIMLARPGRPLAKN